MKTESLSPSDFLSTIKDPIFLKFASDLLDAGFTIIHTPSAATYEPSRGLVWFHYTDGKGFGYAALNRFFGIDLSSEYKPSKEHGTGASHVQGETNPTVEQAKIAAMTDVVRPGERERPRFYKSLDEFLANKGKHRDLLYIVKQS